ncbi:MAG: hypothetical protein R2681_15860 [Pyrinomonadaceae bacterium]
MTKHFAGILLFTFIVGASVLTAGLFYSPQSHNGEIKINDDPSEYGYGKRKCRFDVDRRYGDRFGLSANVTGAVFDPETALLTTSHQPDGRLKNAAVLYFNFYVKDASGTRFLGRERVPSEAKASEVAINSFRILDQLNSYQNLYLITTYESTDAETTGFSDNAFHERSAIPVLLRH